MMAHFVDGKDKNALRTIGEVSEALGIKPHVLRYWEEQFPSLKPLKRAGGRRLYRSEDVALIENIANLTGREGYTLKGARAVLSGAAGANAAAAAAVPVRPVVPADVLARLKRLRADLAEALAA